MKRLESMFILFEKVTVGVVFVTAVYIPVFYGWETEIYANILWQILFLSAVCALGSMILPLEGEKEVSRISMFVRIILYYVYINVVVLGLGLFYEWFTFRNGWQVLGMELAITFVYGMVAFISYRSQCREAKRMNQKLKEIQ